MSFLLVLLIFLGTVSTYTLSNEIVGSPKIECNPDSISFSFNTKNPFRGSVYIRGYYHSPSCRQRYDIMSNQGGMLTVRLGDCGMSRNHQLVPRGINAHVTFVANFHPRFTTKEDRAFVVRCFYAHTDSVVKTDIDVNGVIPETLEQATSIVPKCEYTLREGSLDGPRVRNTQIGLPIFHRWDCDTNGNYGILIRSCSILDSRGGLIDSAPIIDEKGCAISPEFPEVVYSPALNSAYAVIEAISIPDQPSISFACQIQYCDKTTDDCLGVSPPRCVKSPKMTINHEIIANRITETFDNLQVEPWMKEPTPDIDDETNSTTTIHFQTTTASPKLVKLVELNLDEWPIESNELKNREKRLADNVIDIESDEMYIDPFQKPESLSNRRLRDDAGEQIEKEAEEEEEEVPICIPVETVYSLTLVMIMIIILSLGTLIYLGGHFAKKRKEIESMVKEPYYMSKI